MKKLGPTEQQIHEAVVERVRISNPNVLMWHTPNGGLRHVVEGKKFQRMGVLPGVSDLLFFHNNSLFALELKRRGAHPTDAQEEFMERVREAGGYAFCVDGVDEAYAVLKSWGIIGG